MSPSETAEPPVGIERGEVIPKRYFNILRRKTKHVSEYVIAPVINE